MITRKEICNKYEVNQRGIICSPGKFEEQMLYVPHLWNHVLEGYSESMEDDDNNEFDRVYLIPQDKTQFPELGNAEFVDLYEDNDGFVRAYSSLE